jgi:hypothetical protein
MEVYRLEKVVTIAILKTPAVKMKVTMMKMGGLLSIVAAALQGHQSMMIT